LLPDGSTKPLEDKTDWDRLRAMSDEEVTAAALADPDALPMTADRASGERLAMTQEEFAALYHIPIGTLRVWEQGRCEPDQGGSVWTLSIHLLSL
jgi:putative transcriptional regulator